MSEIPPPPGHPLPHGAPPPAPSGHGHLLSPPEQRTWGMVAHVLGIASWGLGLPFLGPLVVYLVYRDRGAFVRGHAAEALNAAISTLLYTVALALVLFAAGFVTFGLAFLLWWVLALPAVGVLVCGILGAVAASSGRAYRYPLVLRLVH
ncbi:hypothetical protein NUM3379_20800 [Kineococcus sp. NUM-3379]